MRSPATWASARSPRDVVGIWHDRAGGDPDRNRDRFAQRVKRRAHRDGIERSAPSLTADVHVQRAGTGRN
jgi:hypothetical protein